MKVLDLFSGIGGFALGMQRAGFEIYAFCEIDYACRLVLKKHWPNVLIFNDIKDIDGKSLNGTIDLVCGGFPCQDISVAGKRRGLNGKRSSLWWEFQRLIKEIQPKYAVIENVSSLRTKGLDEVLSSLVEIGYDAQWHCIPACAIGAPHQRDRLFILAYPKLHGLSADTFPGSYDKTVQWPKKGEKKASYSSGSGSPGLLAAKLGEYINVSRSKNIWRPEPRICRVVNGLPGRVDRIKQLGNAVIPEIAEIIGRAILENNYKKSLHLIMGCYILYLG